MKELNLWIRSLANNPNIAETYYWNGRLLINKEEVEFIDKAH